MQKSVLIIILCCVAFTGNLSAQRCGKVTTSQSVPLVGVHVRLNDDLVRPGDDRLRSNEDRLHVATDEAGDYCLPELKPNDRLTFTHVGYQSKVMAYWELEANRFQVKMVEDNKQLEEVVVVGRQTFIPYLPYKKLADMPRPLSSFGSVAHDGKIYIVGGDETILTSSEKESAGNVDEENSTKTTKEIQFFSDKLFVYDIEKNSWETVKNQKFRKRAYHNMHYYKNKLYVFGGKNLSTNRRRELLDNNLEVYDLLRDTIMVDPINPHQAVGFTSVLYKDVIIVLGGSVKKNQIDQKIYSPKVHAFNLRNGFWYEMKELPAGKEAKGILVGNSVYLIGGHQSRPLDAIETYNLQTGETKNVGKLPHAVARPALACVDKTIYVFEEGKMQTFDTVTGKVKIYNLDLSLINAEMFYHKNKLYLVGGYINDEYKEASCDVYSINMSDFEKTEAYSL